MDADSTPSGGHEPPIRLRVRFSGRVQGVGFRATARAVASDHRVTGWVRNEPDGTVLAEVQGESGQVREMLEGLRARMSHNIRGEQVDPIDPRPDESRFEIRR